MTLIAALTRLLLFAFALGRAAHHEALGVAVVMLGSADMAGAEP